MSENKISGAEAVMRSLINENVDTIFGYPGGAIMPIYDSLYHYMDQVNHILSRHEQGSIHSAQGYARTSGKPGVVFATSGPGATNLITGLADALIDSTPLVCITGQVASHLLGTDAFQETDVVGISMPITKWNYQITKADEIAEVIARAFYIAKSGRPGPVLIDITKDAQLSEVDFELATCNSIRSYKPHPKLNQEDIQAAADLINAAEKPYLLVGQGIILSEAENELLQFVEKAGIPVGSTLLGLGAFPESHEFYGGYLGMHGDYAANIKTNECDVLIAIGMRFDDRVTGDTSRYATQAKVIHIDIDAAELNKIIKTNVAIHADAKDALTALIDLVEPRKHQTWLQEFKDAKQIELDTLQQSIDDLDANTLRMEEVIKLLSKISKDDAIIVTDVGQHQMMVSRYYTFNKTKSNITSGGLGTMGFALPAAIGAKLGSPNKDVIAVAGDGGFQMTLQELGTVLQNNIDVKILILNNHYLGMVRQWQELFFENRYSFTDISSPDFVTLAKAYGIDGQRIDQREDLEEAMQTMLNHKGSYLLEVTVAKEENVFPMVQTGASVSEIRLK